MSIVIVEIGGTREEIEITKEKYEQIKLLKEKYFNLLRLEEIYNNLIKNYKDFEMCMFEMSLDNVIYRDYSWSGFKNKIHESDRLIINLLTHTSMYFKYGDSILIKVYGEDSKEYKFFDDIKSSKFDSNFSYRLMDSLRNYVIHRDLPVGSLSYSLETITIDGENKRVADCSPSLNIKKLREDKKLKGIVRNELKDMDEVKLRPHIRSFITDISGIKTASTDSQLPSIQSLTKELISIKELFKNPEKVYGVEFINNGNDSFSYTFDMFDRIYDLLDMNSTYLKIDEMVIL